MERSLILTSATMSEPTAEMPDDSISRATLEEANLLADLYAKQFRATGHHQLAEPERREDLVKWITQRCADGKLWVIRDSYGPITLCDYEFDQKEVITIVTRDGMERNGYGAKMLSHFAGIEPGIKIKPITNAGRKMASKCGFSKEEASECTWTLSADFNQS